MYRISVAERGLTGIANIFRSRLSRLNDLLRAGTVPLTLARTGGVGAPPPPRCAAGFWATLWGKPCAIFGKKKLTRSGQVTEL